MAFVNRVNNTDPHVIEALEKALQDESPFVRLAAKEALSSATHDSDETE